MGRTINIETPPEPPAPPAPLGRPRRPLYRRILWWGLISGAILFVLLALAWVSYSAWAHRQVNRELRLIADAGEPLNWEAFYLRYPRGRAPEAPGPDFSAMTEEDFQTYLFEEVEVEGEIVPRADPFYAAALEFRRSSDYSGDVYDIMQSVMRGETEWTPDLSKRVRDWLDERELLFELLDRGAAVEHSNFRLPRTAGGDFPEFSLLRALANDLAARARWQIYHGEADAALDSLLCMLQLSRVLDTEPILIARLVQIAMQQMATIEAVRVLNSAPLSEASLLRLAEALRAISDEDLLERTLFAERIWFMEIEGDMSKAMIREWWFNTWDDRIPILPPMERHYKAASLREIRLSLHAVRRPYAEQAALYPAAMGGLSIDRLVITEYRDNATIRALRAAVAIELYRIGHDGLLPDSLEQLVSAGLLEVVPLDPFTSEPLKLLVTDDAYTIYGVGENVQDDGGLVEPIGIAPDDGVKIRRTPSR